MRNAAYPMMAALTFAAAVPCVVAPAPVWAAPEDEVEVAGASRLAPIVLPNDAHRSTSAPELAKFEAALRKTAETNHGKIGKVEVLIWKGRRAKDAMKQLPERLKEAGYNCVTRPAFDAEPGRVTPLAAVRKDKKDDILGMWIQSGDYALLVWGIYKPDNPENPGHPVGTPPARKPQSGARPGAARPSSEEQKRLDGALEQAIEEGTAAEVKKLLKEGADPNGKIGNLPFLQVVCARAKMDERLEKAATLLDAGADPERGDGDSFTPLITAALKDDVALIDLLLDKGADVNGATPKGSTALHATALVGHVEAAKRLLKRGADVNARTGGKTALQLAEQTKQIALAELLREAEGARTASGE